MHKAAASRQPLILLYPPIDRAAALHEPFRDHVAVNGVVVIVKPQQNLGNFILQIFTVRLKGFHSFGEQKRTDSLSTVCSLCRHYLSFRAVTSQVFSARVSLTAVFGMGTGGPSPQSAPTALF